MPTDHPIAASYAQFKSAYAKQLSQAKDLQIEDVHALIVPLSLEQITDQALWDNLSSVILAKEHQIPENKYLQHISDFAWAMSKVSYKQMDFWVFVEQVFQTELEKLKVKDDPAAVRAGFQTMTLMCHALGDV